MSRRSLLGGAKRQEQARRQQEAEHAWTQQAEETFAAPAVQGRSLPADAAGEGQRGPVPPAHPDSAHASGLHWIPRNEPGQTSSTAGQADPSPQKTDTPIEWTLDDDAFGGIHEPTTESDRASPAAGRAASPSQMQTSETDIAPALLDVTEHQVRDRALRRLGWLLLCIVLGLTVVLSLL